MVCGSVWYGIWFAVRSGNMRCKTKVVDIYGKV